MPDKIRSQLKLVRGDVRDSAFLNRIVRGQAVVFHLAALIAIPYSYAAAQSYVETNILGTVNVLEAARQWETERVVHTSTSEVYGTAQTMPGWLLRRMVLLVFILTSFVAWIPAPLACRHARQSGALSRVSLRQIKRPDSLL